MQGSLQEATLDACSMGQPVGRVGLISPLCGPKPLRWAAWIALAFQLGCSPDLEPTFRPQPTTDYSDPDRTLETMARAIADKGRTSGGQAYAGALAESTSAATPGFHQFFWPEDQIRWESISGRPAPADWNNALERNFYTRFVALRGEGYQMTWSPGRQSDDVSPTLATLYRQYVVTTQSGDSIAIGQADLYFYKSASGNWLIRRWDDRPDFDRTNPTDPEQQTLGLRRLGSQ
ncbi:MAG TPA: hypothetical protein VGK93_04405 [Candidatus Eisenbacteria bacterium]|jgi:hypothetical protein